ncbi:hypothetical protein [Brevundimonas faecalis]|uniref:Secreted protein n=1 Tax=Brevundimonas faecalis TaxID=947378 RepID=A0ABV2R9M6_9CAUL
MKTLNAKPLLLAAVLGVAATALAACGEPSHDQNDGAVEVQVEEDAAPAAEDSAAPAVAEVPAIPTDAPPPVETLPPEKRTSEESVQPESETLFY